MAKAIAHILLISSSLLLCLPAYSQAKAEAFPFFNISGGFQIPGADLAADYGTSAEIGGGSGYKTSSNLIGGLEMTFIFGPNVKNDPLDSISNEVGQITNIYGDQSQIYLSEHGFHLKLWAGKIFPLFNANPNSGLLLRGSVGMLQHKIFIRNVGNNTPQVTGDYVKGYDRMCNGLALSEFIGWQNFSPDKGYHFQLGFEFTQAFTQNRRSWDFATQTQISQQRLDLLYTFKVAWFIPLHRKQSSTFYYY